MKFVKVKSVKEAKSEDIYHLTVQNNHNFFGNEFCLHNCGFKIPNEIQIILYNLSNEDFVVKNGDRIAQGVLNKVPIAVFREVQEQNEEDILNNRKGGFGSTGI